MTAVGRYEDDPMPALALGVRQLIRSGEHLRNLLARQLRIGPTDLIAIEHLYTDGPLTPRELAARMDLTSGTVTALLDRLEQAGLLARSNNPKDRRSLLISTTAAGEHAVQWVFEQFDTALHQALPTAPGLSTGQLADLLSVLAEALDARAADPAPTDVQTAGHSHRA
jgi:DNA-binding MarR family transcriptional regulator